VEVLERRHWVVWLPQVPNLEARVLVVVIGHHELSWDLRVPCQTCLSQDWLLGLAALRPLIVKVIKVVILLGQLLGGFGEVEYGFVDLKIPHDDLPVLRGASQYVRDHSVPADRGNP